MRAATFSYIRGTGQPAPDVTMLEITGEGRTSGGFESLIDRDGSVLVILFSLLAALGFGMIHALGPGHGKTVVAAYLVGSRGTVRHAVALGATVTATHTSTVYIVGFIALAASSEFATEKVQLYIGVAAGLMIVAMGLSLFISRFWRYLHPRPESGLHRHGLFGRAHSHMPNTMSQGSCTGTGSLPAPSPMLATVHVQPGSGATLASPAWYRGQWSTAANANATHSHDHATHGHGHAHPHPHSDELAGADLSGSGQGGGVTWRGLLTLGVAGGMLPCPSAIVVMISAIALGKIVYGMLLIVAFSLGLAGVLTGIGIALVLGRRISRDSSLARSLQRPAFARLAGALPIMSAAAVTIAGIGVTLVAVNQAQIL